MASFNNKDLEVNGKQQNRPSSNESEKENLTGQGGNRSSGFSHWNPKHEGIFGGGDCRLPVDNKPLNTFTVENSSTRLEQKDMNNGGGFNIANEYFPPIGEDAKYMEEDNENQNSSGETLSSPTPSDGHYHSVLSERGTNGIHNVGEGGDGTLLEDKDLNGSNEDTGTYESATENEAEESDIEIVSDTDTSQLSLPTPTADGSAEGPRLAADPTNGSTVFEFTGVPAPSGQDNVQSPPTLNWDEFNFESRHENSSMCVNYDSFMTPTPTPKKLPRLSLDGQSRSIILSQQFSDSDTTDSPLNSSRSAPPDLSTVEDKKEDEREVDPKDSLDFQSPSNVSDCNISTVAQHGSPAPISRKCLASPLHASTPSSYTPRLASKRLSETDIDDLAAAAAGAMQASVTSDSLKFDFPINGDSLEEKDSVEVSTSISANKSDTFGNSTNSRSCSASSTGTTKKRNSVTFNLTTVDIEEVLSTRPPPDPKKVAMVSPSILVNAGSIDVNTNVFFPKVSGVSSSSDEEFDDALAEDYQLMVDELKMAEHGSSPKRSPQSASVEKYKFPIAVTEFVDENGVKVYVVGTANYSKFSIPDVTETIEKVQPKMVVVELSPDQMNIISLDEDVYEDEIAKMAYANGKSTLKKDGILKGLFNSALLTNTAFVVQFLEMLPGVQYRAAVEEASNIKGCTIIFGDLPYEVTFARLTSVLGFFQKVTLTRWLLSCNDGLRQGEVAPFRNRDVMMRMLAFMAETYPATCQVFIEERAKYLSYSLRKASISAKSGSIVGIVNSEHVAGVLKHWGNVTDEEIAEISSLPEPSPGSTIIRGTIKITCYLLIGYGMFKLSKSVFGSNVVSKLIPGGFLRNALPVTPAPLPSSP